VALIEAGEVPKQVNDLLRTRVPGSRPGASAGCVPGGADAIARTWLPAPLHDVLRRRESVRDFAPTEIPVQQIVDLITGGYVAERHVWPPAAHGDAGLTVLLAACRVAGLAEGIYAVEPGSQSPAPVPGPPSPASVREAYADAPALLLICADPHQQARDAGGSSYGSLIVRSGTLGYAMWLAAVSGGLAGCGYGSSCHDMTLAARQWDPRYRHFFTVAIGMPAGRSQRS
jgi:hypothetical protein